MMVDTKDASIPGWPEPEISGLSKDDQKIYLRRKRAMVLRVAGEKTPTDIKKLTGMRCSEQKRRLKICTSLHEDGQVWGFRALLWNVKTKYVRSLPESESESMVGMWTLLLSRHEELGPFLMELKTKGRRRRNGGYDRVDNPGRHIAFLDKCSELGIRKDEYPFTSGDKGYRSMLRFYQEKKESKSVVVIRNGRAANLAPGTGVLSGLLSGSFLSEVQFDGHEINAAGVVRVPLPGGSSKLVPLWSVTAITAVCSTGIPLGGDLSLAGSSDSGSYTEGDVQSCLAISMGQLDKPQRMEDAWLPVHMYPDLEWAPADTYNIDRHLSHRGSDLSHVIQQTFNSRALYLKPYEARGRAVIEAFHSILAGLGFKIMPSGFSAKATQKERALALKAAKELEITWEELRRRYREALWYMVSKPSSKFGATSALDMIGDFLSRHGRFLRRVPEDLREPEAILRQSFWATLRGNIKERRFNQINRYYGVYRGPETIGRDKFVGKKVFCVGNKIDARYIKVYHDNQLIDQMRVMAPWNVTPHTWEMRIKICGEARRLGFKFSLESCALRQWSEFVAGRIGATNDSQSRERDARTLERIRKEALGETAALDNLTPTPPAPVRPAATGTPKMPEFAVDAQDRTVLF